MYIVPLSNGVMMNCGWTMRTRSQYPVYQFGMTMTKKKKTTLTTTTTTMMMMPRTPIRKTVAIKYYHENKNQCYFHRMQQMMSMIVHHRDISLLKIHSTRPVPSIIQHPSYNGYKLVPSVNNNDAWNI